MEITQSVDKKQPRSDRYFHGLFILPVCLRLSILHFPCLPPRQPHIHSTPPFTFICLPQQTPSFSHFSFSPSLPQTVPQHHLSGQPPANCLESAWLLFQQVWPMLHSTGKRLSDPCKIKGSAKYNCSLCICVFVCQQNYAKHNTDSPKTWWKDGTSVKTVPITLCSRSGNL